MKKKGLKNFNSGKRRVLIVNLPRKSLILGISSCIFPNFEAPQKIRPLFTIFEQKIVCWHLLNCLFSLVEGSISKQASKLGNWQTVSNRPKGNLVIWDLFRHRFTSLFEGVTFLRNLDRQIPKPLF
jgi:hypothetical protein